MIGTEWIIMKTIVNNNNDANNRISIWWKQKASAIAIYLGIIAFINEENKVISKYKKKSFLESK